MAGHGPGDGGVPAAAGQVAGEGVPGQPGGHAAPEGGEGDVALRLQGHAGLQPGDRGDVWDKAGGPRGWATPNMRLNRSCFVHQFLCFFFLVGKHRGQAPMRVFRPFRLWPYFANWW